MSNPTGPRMEEHSSQITRSLEGLSLAECGEWLAGFGGYQLGARLELQGDAVRAYYLAGSAADGFAPPSGSPKLITLIQQGSGPVEVRELWEAEEEADDPWACDCGGCDFCRHQAGEEIFSMAALRELGR